MTVKHFKRNWMLHYLQWVYLYLPDRNNRNKEFKITIKPISYVHSGYRQMGQSIEHSFQYFYADYSNPIDTGTLSFEPTQFQTGGEEKPKPIPQLPCKYRIYTYCDEIKKIVPIKTTGEFDLECSDDSLYENTQSFTLIPNIKYYYREEQASEGDLLHKELEEFGIDEEKNIILYQENSDEKLFNRVEKSVEIDEKTGKEINYLKIRHYPKFVKIYVTFDKREEVSSVANRNVWVDFYEEGWLGFHSIKEGWTNALSNGSPWGSGATAITKAKRYRVGPKSLHITYMEKEVGGLSPVEKARKNKEPIKQYVNRQLIAGVETPGTGGMYGGGRVGYAVDAEVIVPDPCTGEWYLGDTLLHTGEEISWSDTGSPNFERYQDPEDRKYGHYFHVPSNGGGDSGIANGSLCSTFWIRKFLSGFADLIGTYRPWKETVTDSNGNKYERTRVWYGSPFYASSTKFLSVQGELVQTISDDYSSDFDKPLVRLKINSPEVKVISTITNYKDNGHVQDGKPIKTTNVVRDNCYGYGWAGVEDVVGMACWAMSQVTKYDPDREGEAYTQWGCLPGMPLYIAWGQYENSDTKDFTKDTVSVTQGFAPDDPLMVFDSPIIRKGEAADYSVDYAIYDEDKFKFINENCDKGCSCVVSYVKTTRQNYFNFIHESDPSLRDNWLIKK